MRLLENKVSSVTFRRRNMVAGGSTIRRTTICERPLKVTSLTIARPDDHFHADQQFPSRSINVKYNKKC